MSTQDDDERKLPPFPKPLSSAQVLEALKGSPDAGITVILSKLGISDIGAFETEELANAGQDETGSIVQRLALGNNRLSNLPPEFSLFARLRYLNLKHNSFTVFPDVLTLIPSLDTLDLSHNRIRKLPSYPGNLVRLRVLCLSRNKLARLPLYITQFRNLEVLQMDRNPLEWPPKTVIESFGDIQDASHGKNWIRNLYSWMEASAWRGMEYDDSGYSEQPDWEDDPRSSSSWQFPHREGHFDPGPTPHARSFSIDSNTSISSIPASSHELDVNEHHYAVDQGAEPSPNYIGRFTPRESEMSSDSVSENSYTSPRQGPAAYEGPPDTEQLHSRTKSHASSLRKPQHPFVAGKKSLPDLRNAHKDPGKRIPDLPEKMSPTYFPRLAKASADSFFPSNSLREDNGSSSGSFPYPTSACPEDIHLSDSGGLPFVAAERNSYFHRSSTITINYSLPRSLLCLHESARSILFAMGQLYQALEHYVHQGLDERLSSAFKRVLDPANVNLLHLIRSLDRFDDVSQKSIPSPALCRGLVESCRDTVTTFRRAVGLLILQTGLDATDDSRFVRWLILELYGTTAELSFAWQAMAPEIETLKPFMCGSVFSNSTPFSIGSESESSMSSTPLFNSEDLAPVVRLRPADSTLGTGRARTARRHAGSFSSKDVQIGKELPSYDILPSMAGGLATHTPTLRTPKRLMTVPIVTSSTSGPSSSYFGPSTAANPGHHLRYASQSSLPDSSSLMSLVTSFESQASNQTVINREVLHAIQNAADIAPIVWDQIEDALGDIMHSNSDIREALEGARSVTRGLSRHLFDIFEGDSEAEKNVLREDAHSFVKVIVQLSNILKMHGNPRSVSSTLRSNLVKLTNCTEDFAILLHVSSISFHTPRSSSPSFYSKHSTHNRNPQPLEDNLLASSLSRSRSAQATLGSVKQSISTPNDGSSTAFLAVKPPNVKRLRIVRDVSIDSSNPG